MMNFFCLITFATAAVSMPSAIAAAASLPGARVCIDEAGHRADCTADDVTSIRGYGTRVHYQDECRAADRFGRCPTDPMCFDEKNQATRCVGQVVFATAQCAINRLQAPLCYIKDVCRTGASLLGIES